MRGEDWEFRREARRCRFAASQAQRRQEQRMLSGFARFYEALAGNDNDMSSEMPDRARRQDQSVQSNAETSGR
jgi:hypothetical protein